MFSDLQTHELVKLSIEVEILEDAECGWAWDTKVRVSPVCML